MTIAEGHCPARSRLNRGNLENPNVSCAKTWRCPGAVWPMRRRGLPNRCGGKSTAIGGLRRTKTARRRCYNRPGLHWPVWCVIVDYTHQFLHHWNFIGVFVCRLHPRPWSLDRDYRVSGGPHVVRAKGGVSGLPETTPSTLIGRNDQTDRAYVADRYHDGSQQPTNPQQPTPLYRKRKPGHDRCTISGPATGVCSTNH